MATDVDEKTDRSTPSAVVQSEQPPETDQAAKAARPEREATAKDYFRIFSYARKWDFALIAAAALASMGAGCTLPLMNVVFGKLVGTFNDYFVPGTTTTKAEFMRIVNRQALYIFLLFIARFVLNYINKFSFRMIGIRMSAAIRLAYLRSLFAQSIHVLDSMPPGAAAGTITTTANTLQLGISEKLGTFTEFSATIVASIIIAFTYSWALTLVTGSVILFILLVISILLPFIIKGTSRLTKAEQKASAVASEAFGSIRMVTACGAESRVTARYTEWVKIAMQHGQTTAPLLALQFGLIFFGLYSAFALSFWYGSKAYSEGSIHSVGTVVIVLMSVMLMVISLERISTPLIAVSKAMVAAAEFFAVIDAPRPDTGHLKDPDVSASEDIVFKGVTFAYPGRPHVKVIDNLDLTIETGKVTAIVGPSGSGKSTIVGLVERWYTLHDQYVIARAVAQDPTKKKKTTQVDSGKDSEKKTFWSKLTRKGTKSETDEGDEDDDPVGLAEESGPPVQLEGTIEVAGRKLDDVDLKWWRSQIGLVQQEPFLFNDTIYANVMHGLVGTQWENEPLEVKKELARDACKEAFADEFIDRLPDGYDTQVGDSGTKLSGGQRQRLAIARSIVKKPKILILDEATSAIDVRSEKIIQLALDKVSQGRTTITIAHRLSTIRKADKIVVLQKGRLVEQGTHESLLENEGGVYSGLVQAQSLALGADDDHESGPESDEDIETILAREKSAARSETESTRQITKWKNRGLIGSFGRLLYEQKSRWPVYFIIVIFAACAAAGIPLQAYLFAKIIVVYQYTGSKLRHESEYWSLMWLVLAICLGFSYLVLGFAATQLQHYICAVYRQQYFSAMLYQKIDFFDDEEHSTGSLTARVAGDPKQLEELLGMNMAMVYTSIFQLIGGLAVAYAYGWKLALVAMFVTVPLGLAAGYFRLRYELQFEKMYAEVFSESSKWASESIGAFRTVSSLTLEDIICDRYSDLLYGHVNNAFRKSRWTTLIFAMSDSVSLGCQALIFWYGGRLLASHEYNVLNFLICYMAVIQGAESAGQGMSFGPNAAQASAAANRILSIRETRNTDNISTDEKIPHSDGGAKIELRDVSFKYPTRNVSIFKHLNITIEEGQFAALVGASGSGKTSIVSLLERFYDPQHGQILLNGKDIKDVNVYEYRKLLSLVAQEASLFQGTIRDNILLGVDPSTVTDEQIHSVCREAAMHDFIVSLPDGYDTNVGSKGVALSGGQKQRIAIARALMRDPQVLLLDEATSSLDSESEKLISAAIQKVAKGRTTVAVAHRLSTIQNADIIYVLGEGRVLEKGNHAELLRQKGVYWHMCHSQALDR
ncbi:ABC transporter transmembrane region [Pleurostoma richardsiae]|uniref:ABC transporter transmembrane region n=1 Tax=Pleurostoma richardsiae TaxID=41990 RepID=A0AA38S7P9_9PEZI|nr:ABC transporter transmembrane region [Pleurostoma richardsiae]